MKPRNSTFALARAAGALRTKTIRNKKRDVPRRRKHKARH